MVAATVAAPPPEPAGQASMWTAADEARLAELLRVEYDGETLDAYIRRVSPRLPPPRHVKPVIQALQEARDASRHPDSSVRIILIEMPPRHAKTTTVMHALAWRVTRDPSITNAYLTYGQNLADTKSRIMRQHVVNDNVPLAGDMANLAEWRTPWGGGMLCGGILGPLTGKGIDGFLVIDDPIKNRQEAESETIRDTIWDQFTDVAYTRLEGAATIVVMATRWHPDDLIGRILAKEDELREELGDQLKIIRIRLPALAETGDPLGRAPGEALWPERFNERRLKAIRAVINEYSFAALYQQNPRLKGTILFCETPSRFQLYEVHDSGEWAGQPDTSRLLWRPRGHRLLVGCDPAASEKTKADYSAAYTLAALGWGEDMEVWVIDGFSRHVTVPDLVRMLNVMRQGPLPGRTHWDLAVAVESVGAFVAVPQMLFEEDPTLPVIPVRPVGDKWMNAQFTASLWNRGKLHVPSDAPWAKNLIHRLSNFTGAKGGKDDEVDAISHGCNELFKSVQNETPNDSAPAMFAPFG
jgi:predicted phage terminase large subunit-like protein